MMQCNPLAALCRVLSLGAIYFLVSACFDPTYPVGIPCSERQTCPPNQLCGIDNVCRPGPSIPEPACGNGIVDSTEVCDDGNTASGDGCSADCLSNETCGNGYLDVAVGEACDDGNNTSGDGCSADCTLEAGPDCGNGTVEGDEQCDDGNNTSGDGCSADCLSDETCGNVYVDVAVGEACDDGNDADGDGCSADCRSTETCGNTITDEAVFEECDDGNTDDGDGCSADCKLEPRCGDGVTDPTEECDDDGNSASCDADCTLPLCGDAFLNPEARTAGSEGRGFEQCDEGGTTATCDVDCTVPECGDGLLNPAAGEECDDDNTINGDGCDSVCRVEALLCGNGQLEPGEELDPPPGPSQSVPVDDATCRFDFSAIDQLYCAGACGTWDGAESCQAADADVFCRIKTGNPDSVALDFTIDTARDAPGICCPPPALGDPAALGCVALGVLSSRGVDILVSVHDASLRASHGNGDAISNVVCSP